MGQPLRFTLPLLAGLALSSAAIAQPGMMTPGSVLIFPLVDFGGPARTIVTITNLNTSRVVCAGGFRVGDVRIYVQAKNGANCLITDRTETLTPGDTLSFRVDEFIPGASGEDWLWVEALDPVTGRPIDFDFLIGSANLGELHPNQKWWYGAYSFKSFVAEGGSPFGSTPCGHAFTGPVGDPDLDFDGVEYAGFPQRLLLDFFVGEGTPPELPAGTIVSSRLVLVSPAATPTTVAMVINNNNEDEYSRSFQFTCLRSTQLAAVSPETTEGVMRMSYDAGELGGLPTGWISMRGTNGILGVFVQRAFRADEKPIQGFGRALHFDGVRTDVKLVR
jgi:hypothetical protein